MSFRAWLSIITLVLIAVIIFFSRHQLYDAWHMLAHVNIWILLLLIPGQLLVYYAGGGMIFSYLKGKSATRNNIPGLSMARMALEMNFVNHVLPSAGVSGISYMGWRLGHYGVSGGRATMAQIVRFAMGFVSFIILLIVAVFIVTLDGSVNRWIILISCLLVGFMLATIFGGMYLISSQKRMNWFARWIVALANRIIRKVTFGRMVNILNLEQVEKFLAELHRDYLALLKDKKLLIKPLLWGLVFNASDVSLFLITFWSLGTPVDPAPMLIAYGVASMAGFFVITPGGVGAYEAIMVAFLAIAGIASGEAIAGIVLTRVIILLGTIGLGYVFYQHALIKYGKNSKPPING